MRQPSKSIDSAAINTSSPSQHGQTSGCQIEIGVSKDVDMQDFRTWWKANVKETRHWGGGPDGVWSGATR